MNNEQTTKDTNPADPDYQDWLTYCKAIATDAKFRGLLKTYFTGHPSEDYAALAVGAQEILSHLMLIRLFQQTPRGSVIGWLARRFPKPCANFSRSSPPKRLVESTWPPAAGRMVLCVLDAGTGVLMNW